VPSAAGLHVTALLRSGGARRAREVTAKATSRGVVFDDLSTYVHDSTTQTAGFVFGLGAADTGSIDAGLEIFADLLRST
jgi:GntR family transcriptional regulator/MocR family aminotransferase